MQDRLIKLSFNEHFINKSFTGEAMMNAGFTNGETTLDELAELINLGLAYSYQFKDGIRKTENFIATDFLAVDVDDGCPLDELLLHPIIKNHCSLWHTTASHSPDQNRYRLIFILPRTLTKPSEVKAAAKSLTRRLSGDMAATDAARFFFGACGCAYEVLGREISDQFLNELLADTTSSPQSESSSYSGATSNRSLYEFLPDLLVKTSDGRTIPTKDLDGGNIHCPFHRDTHPSAFIKKVNSGTFIHCSKCKTTWWMKGSKPRRINFYEFETIVKDIKEGRISTSDANTTSLAKFIDLRGFTANNIFLTDHRHFSLNEIPTGLTFIKSPKGTGKTTYLSGILGKTINRFVSLADYEEQTDFETEERFYSDERILLIGHRRALIGELCQRLGLNCYLDDSTGNQGQSRRKHRYGICLDSLWKIEDQKYDIIVIDEVEQVLNHFLSDTIGEARLPIFKIFTRLVEAAKKVVVLDADISWISYNTLTRIRTSTEQRGNNSPTDVHIYINEWKPASKEIWVYESHDQLVHKMSEAFLQGKRLFISSNSKSKIKTLAKIFEDLASKNQMALSFLCITAENSKKPEIQHFIKNIKGEILKYQVILSSPSLGTGIDITFDDEEQHIDCVFGFFENQINTHFEIDQQLARVRHPKEVHVWISRQEFGFETEFNVVKSDYLRRNLIHVADSGHLDQDIEESVRPFYQLATLLTSHQRASKNRLLHNFIEYKQRQNTIIHRVKEDEEESKFGLELVEIGKWLKDEERCTQILEAKTLNQYEYEKVRDYFNSTELNCDLETKVLGFYRTLLELFYGVPVSSDLIMQDDGGRLRQKIRLLESIRSKPILNEISRIKQEGARAQSLAESKVRLRTIKDHSAGSVLLYGLLNTTPIFNDGEFDDQVVFTTDDLQDFAELSKTVKTFVEAQLGIYTQVDVLKKPVQHLNKLLNLIGLQLKRSEAKKINGRRIYYYKIDSLELTCMMKWVTHRMNNPTDWSFVNTLYGFEYTPDELDWISRIH